MLSTGINNSFLFHILLQFKYSFAKNCYKNEMTVELSGRDRRISSYKIVVYTDFVRVECFVYTIYIQLKYENIYHSVESPSMVDP